MTNRLGIQIVALLLVLFLLYLFLPKTMYSMFYYPDREEYDSPERVGLAYEHVFFNSADGTRLSGWFIPARGVASPRDAKGTVIHMHGNAQNMTAHWSFAEFVPSRGYNLFTFDYRGYGDSTPIRPGPKGVFEDSVAALDYLRSRTDIDTGRLFVFGQSLGGMLAIAAAGASPKGIRAVLAEAPFHSYSAMANDKLPGAGLILDDTYSASTYVAKISPTPLLLMHGTDDVIVPYSHSVRLLAEAGEPKKLITIEEGDHVDAMTRRHGTKYQDVMVQFFDSALEKR
jgi:uncharacterized protein